MKLKNIYSVDDNMKREKRCKSLEYKQIFRIKQWNLFFAWIAYEEEAMMVVEKKKMKLVERIISNMKTWSADNYLHVLEREERRKIVL